MFSVYLFCLVLGGGLGLLSAFGDLFDGDAGDLDLGADADFDLDVDAGGFDHPGTDLVHGADVSHAAAIFSIRSLIFTLFGFGATGTLLTLLGSGATTPLTLIFSILAGLAVGASVGSFLAYLKRSDTGPRGGEEGFVGLSGRVTLPIRAGLPGSIVVRRGNREHSIRALPYRAEPAAPEPEAWDRVVVIEMREGVAYVSPIGDEERELLP